MSCQASKRWRRQKASAPASGEVFSRSDQARVTRHVFPTVTGRLRRESPCKLPCTLPCPLAHRINEAQNWLLFFASSQGDALPVFPWWPNRETAKPDPSPRPKKWHEVCADWPPHTWTMQHIYKNHDRLFPVGAPIPLHHPFIHNSCCPLVRPSRPTSGGFMGATSTSGPRGCCACRGDARFKLEITLRTETANQHHTHAHRYPTPCS